MSIKHRFFSIKDGEEAVNTAGAAYISGMPAKITASGWELAVNTDAAAGNAIGIFRNDSIIDFDPAFEIATVYIGNGKYELSAALGTAADAPFDSTLTFIPDNDLYVDANGKWTNVDPTDQPVALKVFKVTGGTGARQVLTVYKP